MKTFDKSTVIMFSPLQFKIKIYAVKFMKIKFTPLPPSIVILHESDIGLF